MTVKDILNELTLEEKASLCSGKDFWHLEGIDRFILPSVMVTDGPHGLRKQAESSDHLGIANSVASTCFPTAVGLASSWDIELIYQMGEKLGEECLTENVSVLLGPGANIKRHPLCGRNFEYFSEDPFVTGSVATSLIKGIQSKGIGTSIKHFVANNQETMRMSVDSVIDERTLREIYLKGFEMAVKEAQPWTVMCSYNKVNGTYLSENSYFLSSILKDEWKHEGIVVTDWGACNNRVDGLKAGQELEMPGNSGINDRKIVNAVNNGTLDINILDSRVERILSLILKSKETLEKKSFVYDIERHDQFARKVAADTIVLLKNDNSILPIAKTQKVALIGHFAKTPRYQGSGSSLINPTKITTAYDAFKTLLGDNLTYAQGYNTKTDTIDKEMVKTALEVAKNADVVVLMVGLTNKFESEGFDRSHLNIPMNHLYLIDEVSKANNNVIVSLSNGSPIIMPWKDKVDGILEQYLGGQASGGALCDIVFGKVNPSGKIAETFPNSLEEFPSNQNFPGEPRQVKYKEGLFVGYRYYDTANVTPLFPFGFGLSYTSFRYSNLKVECHDSLIVTCQITNTGKVKGKEVVQVYVSKNESNVYRPSQELKGFTKIELLPSESKEVKINISLDSLEVYNIDRFKLENGVYSIKIGASSKDIRLTHDVTVDKGVALIEDTLMNYKDISKGFKPTEEDFLALYGKEIPSIPLLKPYNMNSTFNEIEITFIGRRLKKSVTKQMAKMFDGNDDLEGMKLMVEAMIGELPFRNLIMLSNGVLSENRAAGMLDLMNRKFLRGLLKVIKG